VEFHKIVCWNSVHKLWQTEFVKVNFYKLVCSPKFERLVCYSICWFSTNKYFVCIRYVCLLLNATTALLRLGLFVLCGSMRIPETSMLLFARYETWNSRTRTNLLKQITSALKSIVTSILISISESDLFNFLLMWMTSCGHWVNLFQCNCFLRQRKFKQEK